MRLGAAADAGELGAGLLGPERRAEPFEASERVLERRAGGRALLRAPLRAAVSEQRPRVLERIAAASVLGQRPLERREGAFEIASRREQPNLRLSGQSAWLASTSMRTINRAPGAWAAIL